MKCRASPHLREPHARQRVRVLMLMQMDETEGE